MSYTSLKKRFTVGSTIRVTNNLWPNANGIRTVLVQQANRIASGPTTNSKGETVEKSWVSWPKAAEVRVHEPAVPGEGVPKIEFLCVDGVAFIYELLEEAT